MMLNRVVLIGRLARDPELRYTPQGTPVATLGLAVDRPRASRDAERQTDFIDIVCWRQSAEFAANFLGKGRLAAVEGRLQVRDWTGQDGTRRRAVEVVADSLQPLDRARRTDESEEGDDDPFEDE